MSGCNTKILDKLAPCEPGPARVANITIQQLNPRQLQVTKVIYNFKNKTEKQIIEAIQLEIDTLLGYRPDYKFVNSSRHFNGTGGIEMILNFELKSSL